MHNVQTRFVAVVDDDDNVRAAIAGLVRTLGCDVRQFASGFEFLQAPQIQDAACLITDVRMPNLSGIELHDRLAQMGHTVPTVFVTAFPTPDLMAMLNNAGVIAIIEKPIDCDTLVECVERALGMP